MNIHWLFSSRLWLQEDAAPACWHVLSWQWGSKALPQHSQALGECVNNTLQVCRRATSAEHIKQLTVTDRQGADRSRMQKTHSVGSSKLHQQTKHLGGPKWKSKLVNIHFNTQQSYWISMLMFTKVWSPWRKMIYSDTSECSLLSLP